MGKAVGMKAERAAVFGQSSREVKDVTVQQILEWAFQREKVRLDAADADQEVQLGRGYGIGNALVLVQMKELGCFVDGGGSSTCHEEAEAVAAIVGNLADEFGGRRFAFQIAAWARMGGTPDWMPGAAPKVTPADWFINRHGRHAVSLVIESDVSGWDERSRLCPIVYLPTARQIEIAREVYVAWVHALREVRDNLTAYGGLRSFRVTHALPPLRPWLKSS